MNNDTVKYNYYHLLITMFTSLLIWDTYLFSNEQVMKLIMLKFDHFYFFLKRPAADLPPAHGDTCVPTFDNV